MLFSSSSGIKTFIVIVKVTYIFYSPCPVVAPFFPPLCVYTNNTWATLFVRKRRYMGAHSDRNRILVILVNDATRLASSRWFRDKGKVIYFDSITINLFCSDYLTQIRFFESVKASCHLGATYFHDKHTVEQRPTLAFLVLTVLLVSIRCGQLWACVQPCSQIDCIHPYI